MTNQDINTPTLDEAVNCVCFNLRKTARAVTQNYDAALAPTGLKATQFTLMQAVSLSQGVTLGPLADLLGMDRTTLTRNLAALERKGLIELRSGEDRRERQARLTTSGDVAFREAVPLWRSAQKNISGQLGATHWAHLRNDLESLTAIIAS